MPTLTVRDIPEDLYERLRERAAGNRRSMSSEIVVLLERTLQPQTIDPEALIAEAKVFQPRFREPLPDLTAEAKRAGRKYENDVDAGDPGGEELLDGATGA